MPSPPKASPVALRVELLNIEPLIWRRIVVSNQWTFAALHNYLQWVMGWHDSHAHEFRVGDRCIAPDWWIQELGMDGDVVSYKDERRTSIAAVVRELGVAENHPAEADEVDPTVANGALRRVGEVVLQVGVAAAHQRHVGERCLALADRVDLPPDARERILGRLVAVAWREDRGALDVGDVVRTATGEVDDRDAVGDQSPHQFDWFA